jgi:hypothetical protein
MSETRIEIKKDNEVLVSIPLCDFPGRAQLRECYETDTEIIVLGEPLDGHNCDDKGCSSCFHVRYRFKKMEEL